ncbi:MAG: glycosyltransferase family 2 protein [Candidatus Pacearchaeota archaeon]
MKLSIIIPVYNEEKTIKELIFLVKKVKLPIDKEIIVVDDCSKDNSLKIIKKIKGIKLITHKKNQGKGAAVKTGIRHSTGDIIIIQDADLEYDPNEYVQVIKPILDNKAEVVYGSRILKKENKKSSIFFYFGGRFISFLSSILVFRKITDEPTCYKAFKSDIIKNIKIDGNGFEWEPEITIKLLKQKNLRYIEVPISYKPRAVDEGKKIKFKDGFIAILTLFKYRFLK